MLTARIAAVQDQRRWIEDHGATEYGYLLTYGDGGQAIYAADVARLRALMAMV